MIAAAVILMQADNQVRADDTLREMDFAYGRQIKLGSDSPLYRFFLDGHVYRNVGNERLVDLRVFNHHQEAVPLRVRKLPMPALKKLGQQEFPLFPLYAKRDRTSGKIALNFKIDGKETVLNFKMPDAAVSDSGISGFLVDLGEEKKTPERLLVDLDNSQSEYRLAVKVSASDDLNDWKEVVSSAALVKLRFNGHQLTRRHIDLPIFSGRYLRLLFQTPFVGRLPNTVTAFFSTMSSRQTPKTTAVKAIRTSDQSEIYLFDSEGFFPVDRLQLRLAGVNSLVKARISSRADSRQPWRYQTTSIFYRLKIDGAELENPPVQIPMTQDPLYRMEILAGSLYKSSAGPELRLLWYPHECAFVASGEAPFMLTYGNADLIYEAQAIDELLEAIGQKNQKNYLGFARLGPPQVLGGDDRLKPSRYSRELSLRLALWSILLLSILGLAVMAYRLYRQMKMESTR